MAGVTEDLGTFQAHLVQNEAAIKGLEESVARFRQRLAATDDQLIEAQVESPVIQREKLVAGDVVKTNHKVFEKLTDTQASNEALMGTHNETLTLTAEQVEKVGQDTAQHISTLEELLGDRKVRSYDGLCLDGKEDHTVQMWTCAADIVNQVWTYHVEDKSLSNKDRGCLAGADGAAGSDVTTATCNSESVSQQWVYNRSTGLIKGSGATCLDAVGQAVKGGAVKLTACAAGTTHQVFGIIVGATGARQHVEVINKKIWDTLDASSMHSIDMADRRLKRSVVDMDILEGKLRDKIPPVLAKKLRHYGDQQRHALNKLSKAALHADTGRVDEDFLGPIGADLGLTDEPMI